MWNLVGSSSLDLWIRWVSLAKITAAPASDGAVGPHPAGVEPPGADRSELPRRWSGLTNNIAAEIIIRAPAFDGAVGPHPAGVERPGADRGELPRRWRGLANNIAVRILV